MMLKKRMQTKYAMVIDSSKCFNCRSCIVACQLENKIPAPFQRNWVKHSDAANGEKIHFQPGNCMHCDKPACVEACPTGATSKDTADGIVKIDPKLCIGCGSCIPACPYGARFRHPETGLVDKCDYCANRRKMGLEPACVEACPTHARVFGDLMDPGSPVSVLLKSKKLVKVINKKTDTKPVMYYISKTAPANWPVEARSPEPIRFWQRFARPLIQGLVGMSGFAVLVMLGRQLLVKNDTGSGVHGAEVEEDALGGTDAD
jgi:tetrathionate reductase subunit B